MPLSLISTCKPFRGHTAVIQRNALRSWARLEPRPEVLIFGDDEGVKDICEELDFVHIPILATSEFGTPLLSDMIERANREASHDTIGLVNSDIMLTSPLHATVERARRSFDRSLLLLRRWNTPLGEPWDFDDANWEERLKLYAETYGAQEPVYGGIDLFVYPAGLFENVPPFAIGRGRWDSYLIARAQALGVPVVDATRACLTVHQEHDYTHVAYAEQTGRGAPDYASTPEGQRNESLLGGQEFIFTCLNASHVMDSRGVSRKIRFHPAHVLRRLATLPARYPRLPGTRLISAGRPLWKRLRRALEKLQSLRRRRALPYPISVRRRHCHSARPGDGVETFEQPEAISINRARLEHLGGLGLSLEGRRVLDVGCGVGHLAQFFMERSCEVLCVDARAENVEQLRARYPGTPARVFDVERESLQGLGRFDIVFSFGLLYHLENPFRALRELAAATDDLLLLETQVADHRQPLVVFEEETLTVSQAMLGIGGRPTPSFVAMALREAGMAYVSAPRTPPDHPDFRFRWRGNLDTSRNGHPLRAVFIASRRPLLHATLAPLLRD